jgi:hypothetical protein
MNPSNGVRGFVPLIPNVEEPTQDQVSEGELTRTRPETVTKLTAHNQTSEEGESTGPYLQETLFGGPFQIRQLGAPIPGLAIMGV